MNTRMHQRAGVRWWRRPPVLIGGVLALAALAVLLLVWFQPQTLLFDRVVDEDFPSVGEEAAEEPGASATADGGPTGRAEDGSADDEAMAEREEEAVARSTEPAAVLSGDFESRSRYTVTGSAVVYELADGERIVRLEDFESTNGPDLFVYLTAADSGDDDAAIDDDFIDLGVLRGNVGSQNYEIPVDVDLDHYDTVVIWCRRFTVGFGAADLGPAEPGS